MVNALTISSLGVHLNDDTVRIAVGLRLGIPLCKPHTCCMCGANVDCTATHGRLGHRIMQTTGENNASRHVCQQLSFRGAMQRQYWGACLIWTS